MVRWVYTQFGIGGEGHSGIYIGNREIIDLDGQGRIKKVSLSQFTGGMSSREIYVPCYDGENETIGYTKAGTNAEEKLNQRRVYHMLFDNCHQFSAGCITGDFENSCNFLWFLKDEFKRAAFLL